MTKDGTDAEPAGDRPPPDSAPPAPPRMDRTAVSLGHLHAPSGDRAYWLSRTPGERFAAVEYLRQVAYGYDATVEPVQRVVELAELKRG